MLRTCQRHGRILSAIGALLLLLGLVLPDRAGGAPASGERPEHAALVAIDGPIGPATSGFLDQALAQAVEEGAQFLILRIDTPGGLDSATRDIVRLILSSPIPVVGYVAPEGARAASAGTYILYATHVAAMAPATNLGSATPVPISGPAPTLPRPGIDRDPESTDPEADEKEAGPAPPEGDAMRRKVLNDAAAYIRGLAEKRGRNAEWAERAVREGANLTAAEALEQNVVDLVAPQMAALLEQLHGREVEALGAKQVLNSQGIELREIQADWRFRLLAVLANPTIAYILLLAGLYGLLLEGYSPGAILPGVVGAICLLLGLFALQMLPVNFVGLGLMALGIVLLIAEMLAPSFGVLGFGGIVAFVLGSVMLMDSDVPGYAVNLGIIAGIAVFASALMAMTMVLLLRSRRKPVVTGDARQIGQRVEITRFASGRGQARLGGEIWQVRSDHEFPAGAEARVVEVRGLTLIVEPVD